MSTEKNIPNDNGKAKPDLVARMREGYGKHAGFETVGVAWTREDGSIYFKPYGKQIIDNPIYLFKNETDK